MFFNNATQLNTGFMNNNNQMNQNQQFMQNQQNQQNVNNQSENIYHKQRLLHFLGVVNTLQSQEDVQMLMKLLITQTNDMKNEIESIESKKNISKQ
jgi:hypothetical protein